MIYKAFNTALILSTLRGYSVCSTVMHIQKMTRLPFRHTDPTVPRDGPYDPILILTASKVTEPELGPVQLKVEFISCLPPGRGAS